MNEIFSKIWTNRVLLTYSVLFIAFLLPVPYDSAKYVLLGLALLFLTIDRSDHTVGVSKYALSWIILVGYICSSALWAHDISRVIMDGFIWCIFSLLIIVIQFYKQELIRFEKRWNLLLLILFFLLLVLHFGALNLELSFTREWHVLLVRNKNYTVSLLIVLFPYLLFYNSKNQFVRFAKIVSAFFLLNIILILGVRGALFGLGLIMIFKVYTLYNKRIWLYTVLAATTGFVLWHNYMDINQFNENTTLISDYNKEHESRDYLNEISIDMLLENKVFGVGVGNWWTHAYSLPIDHIEEFNKELTITRLTSHNLFTKILGEFGIIGSLLCFALFLWPFVIYVQVNSDRRRAMNKYLGSWMVFLILSIFYATSQSAMSFFSGIHFMGFFSVGMLYTFDTSQSQRQLKVFKNVTTIMLVFCTIWFSFSFLNERRILKARQLGTQQEFALAIKILDQVHVENLYTFYGNNQLLLQTIGELRYQIGDQNEGISHLKRAMLKNPNNIALKFSLAKMLIDSNIDQVRGKELLVEILANQPNFKPAKEQLTKADF